MADPQQLDVVVGMALTVLFIAAGICAIRGFYRFCVDFCNYQLKFREKKLDRAPDSVIDKTLRLLIQNIQKQDQEDNEFVTAIRGSRLQETIETKDDRILIFNYHNPRLISIKIKAVGDFDSDNFKPEIAKELSRVCLAYKEYCATLSILTPDAIKYKPEKGT